jgi:uncharacterized protein
MNKYIKRSGWVTATLLGSLALVPSAQAASFDCSKATSMVEKTICSSKKISSLDEKLAAAYQQSLATGSNKELLKRQQREWLIMRNTCGDGKCIEEAYLNRLRQIGFPESKTSSVFSGQWHIALCDKSVSEECGGFTVYLIQVGDKICGDYLFATPGGGRLNEGAPRSIIGTVAESNIANVVITSGRNDAVLKVRAAVDGDTLNWEVIEEVKHGMEDESALVLEKGKLKRETENAGFRTAFSACQRH